MVVTLCKLAVIVVKTLATVEDSVLLNEISSGGIGQT